MKVRLPNCDNETALPNGWTPLESSTPLTVVGPEQDLRLYLSAAPLRTSMDETAAEAWHQADPGFSYPILQQAEVPSTHGWDKACQIVYNIPASESRIAFAIIRTLGDIAYIALADGSRAAVSRRMAQVSEILEAWKPSGLNPASLVTRHQRPWADQQTQQLNHFIRDAMEKLLIPGVSVAIVQKGEVVYAEGFGVRSVHRPDPVSPATRFMIGSSTKPLTTLMMARLIDQGRFAWTTPVRDLLPDFSLADAEVTRKLEMRHTVCACTGMPRRDVDFLFRFEGISPEQRLLEMKAMRPTTGFGETFQYSNLLVAAGGYAAASNFRPGCGLKLAYEQAMRQLIFEPLGMTNSFLTQEEALRNNAADPHAIDFDEHCVPVDLRIERFADSVAPAGAVWSTAEDMTNYLLLELRGGITSTGERLLSEQTLRSRWRGGIKINDKLGYGLGLLHSEEQGLQVIGHGGNTLGFTSDMFFLPEQDLGVVVLTNLRIANAFLGGFRQCLFEILFGAERKSEQIVEAASKFRHDAAARTRERIKLDSAFVAWIEEFVGEYRSQELGPARITRNGDQFCIQFESWGSLLGAELQPDGARLLALTTAPWNGSMRLQTMPETGDLILDAGQDKYTFQRV